MQLSSVFIHLLIKVYKQEYGERILLAQTSDTLFIFYIVFHIKQPRK